MPLLLEEKGISAFSQLLNKAKAENVEEKFNNTDIYKDTSKPDKLFDVSEYASNLNNNKDIINDDDIKEEIFIESITPEKEDPNGDKDKSSSLHNYTSSQTFGYDNSVTSYNLDFYDYVEDVEK